MRGAPYIDIGLAGGIVAGFANRAPHIVAAWETPALQRRPGVADLLYWRRGDGALGIVLSICDLISLQKRPGVVDLLYWRRGDGAFRIVISICDLISLQQRPGVAE